MKDDKNTCEECGKKIDHIGLCAKHRAIWEKNYADYHQPGEDRWDYPPAEEYDEWSDKGLSFNDFVSDRRL